jgi:hypothetical protein
MGYFGCWDAAMFGMGGLGCHHFWDRLGWMLPHDLYNMEHVAPSFQKFTFGKICGFLWIMIRGEERYQQI